MEDKIGSVGVNIGGGGVGVDIGGHPIGEHPGAGHSGSVGVGVGGGGVGVDVGGRHKGGSTHVNVRHGGGSVSIGKSHHGKPVYVGWNKKPNPFKYNYAAADDQLHDNPHVALFFLEKDMNPGTKMNLHFFKSSNGATFLPRQVAESIPFSSNKMIDILNRFSIQPNSREAETMRKTIKECEQPGIQGEEKFCATSLESMVDFSISKLIENCCCLCMASFSWENLLKPIAWMIIIYINSHFRLHQCKLNYFCNLQIQISAFPPKHP